MFEGCTKLEEITFYGDQLNENVSKDWVKDIYTYGNFISLNVNLPNYEKGFSTIPVNWLFNEQNEFDDLGKQNYFTLTNTTSEEKTVSFKNYPCKNVFVKYKNYWRKQYFKYVSNDSYGNYFVKNNGSNTYDYHLFDIVINPGESISISFDIISNTFGPYPPAGRTIWEFFSDLTGINISGNVWSLFYGNNYDDNTNKIIEALPLFRE